MQQVWGTLPKWRWRRRRWRGI
uniref:TAF15b n=1 Tax=Arundo donax TaxID=35708 RepID=A0A0A9HJU5_ARUDO